MALAIPPHHLDAGATVPRHRLARWMLVLGLATTAGVIPGAAAPASHGARVTGDEPQYLMTAISLAEDGDLDLSDERADGRWRPFHEAGQPLYQEKLQADGGRVSPHDPLLPALLAAPMRAGGWVGAKLALAAMAGALSASLLWVAVRRLCVPLAPAALTVGVFSLSAPLAVYGTQVYPEVAAALAVTLALGAVLGGPTRRNAAAASVAVAVLPWLSVKYVGVAAVLAAVIVGSCGRAGRWPLAAGVLVGLAMAGVVYVVAHQAWYGGWTPYAAGDHFVGGEATVMGNDPAYGGRAVRLIGLLTDRHFGLAVWQPAFLLALPALASAVRRRPPGWAPMIGVLSAGWLTATFLALTMHGWWWPGRQVVVVLPVLVLVTAWWAGQSRGRSLAVLGLGLAGVVTFGVLVTETMVRDITLVVDFDRTLNPLVTLVRPLLPDYRRPSGAMWVLHSLWILVAAGLARWGWGSSAKARPAAPSSGSAFHERREPALVP